MQQASPQQGPKPGPGHSVTLVLGGVRSGKSRYAQQLATVAPRVTVIATAPLSDDPEMSAKIQRHIADRPAHWTTVEEPLDLAAVIHSAATSSTAILIDCLTLFAANLLAAQDDNAATDPNHPHIAALCAALAHPPCAIVLVANEVGSGVVPAYASGRRFRDLAGEINQRVAAIATTVVLMVAGLPLVLKGSNPAEARA